MRQYTFDLSTMTIRDRVDLVIAAKNGDIEATMTVIARFMPDVWLLPAAEILNVCNQFDAEIKRLSEATELPDGTRLLRDMFDDGNKDTKP